MPKFVIRGSEPEEVKTELCLALNSFGGVDVWVQTGCYKSCLLTVEKRGVVTLHDGVYASHGLLLDKLGSVKIATEPI